MARLMLPNIKLQLHPNINTIVHNHIIQVKQNNGTSTNTEDAYLNTQPNAFKLNIAFISTLVELMLSYGSVAGFCPLTAVTHKHQASSVRTAWLMLHLVTKHKNHLKTELTLSIRKP